MSLSFTEPKADSIPFAKVLLLGDAGSGKTHAALTFPSPAVIDAEGSVEWFADRFRFKSAATKSYQEARDLVRQVCANPNGTQTIVLDSLTTIYNGLVNAASEQQLSNGSEDLRPIDHGRIKRKFSSLTDELYHKVPFHVVCIGWIKAQYATPGSTVDGQKVKKNELVAVGEQFDGDKKANHAFDFVFKIEGNDGKSTRARVLKSRSGALKYGQVIENFSWDTLQPIFTKNFAEARRRGMTDEEQLAKDQGIFAGGSRLKGLMEIFARAYPGGKIGEWIEKEIAPDIQSREKKTLSDSEFDSAFHVLRTTLEARAMTSDTHEQKDVPAPASTSTPAPQQTTAPTISAAQKDYIQKVWAEIPMSERVDMTLTASDGTSNNIDHLTAAQAGKLYKLAAAHPKAIDPAAKKVEEKAAQAPAPQATIPNTAPAEQLSPQEKEKSERRYLMSEIESKKRSLGWNDSALAATVRDFSGGRTDILPDLDTAELREFDLYLDAAIVSAPQSEAA